MSAIEIPKCNICQHSGRVVSADYFCRICTEFLCSNCFRYHKYAKISRHHKPHKIDEGALIPLLVKQGCDKHDQRLLLFCSEHEEPICAKCVPTHNRCTNIIDIERAIAYVKPDLRLRNIQSSLLTLKKDINHANMIIKDEMMSIYKPETYHTQMTTAVDRLNKEIESLEIGGVKSIVDYEHTIQEYAKEFNERRQKIEQILNYTLEIQNEPDVDKLIAVHELEKLTKDNKRNFYTMIKQKTITTIVPTCCFEKIKNTILQLEKKPIAVKMRNIKLIKIKTFAINSDQKPNFIRGCAILPNGEFCFTDDNNRLVIITSTGIQRNVPLPCKPIDVVYAGGQKIALTLRENKSVIIFDRNVDETSNLYLDEIKFTDVASIQGLAYDGNNLFVCVGSFGVYILDCIGNITGKIPIKNEINMQYVAFSNDRLFYTKWDENKVYCSDHKGNILWEFQDDMIKATTGVVSGDNGDVYVTGSYSDNVIVISNDGMLGIEIISNTENVHRPYAIDFKVQNSQLLVCSSSGQAILYEVSEKMEYE